MTPLHLEILIHYNNSRCAEVAISEFRDGDFSAPAVRNFIDQLVNMDLLCATKRPRPGTGHGMACDVGYRLTSRGAAHLDALLRVPPPNARWHTEWPKGETE